jgi:autotransporter-associated beta strand protein
VSNNGGGSGTLALGSVGGSGSLLKVGAGILLLSEPGTYAGPTVIDGGRLIAANTTGSATGPGPVSVVVGTLGGTGFVAGNIQVNSGGTIAPGDPLFPAMAPGVLTTGGNVTFNGGTFQVKLNGAAAGTGHDRLQSTGTISLGTGVTQLSTSLGYAPTGGDSLVIMQAGTVAAGQFFMGLPDNTTFLVGSFGGTPYTAVIHYTTTTVFLNNFVAVPEPAHVLLVGGLIGGLWHWRRRFASPRKLTSNPELSV